MNERINSNKSQLEVAKQDYYLSIRNSSSPESLGYLRSRLKLVRSLIPRAETIVSIGTGSGEEIQALKELYGNGAQIIGFDLSSFMIDIAKDYLLKNSLTAKLVQADAANIPLRDNSMDGIFLSAVLHEVFSYALDGISAWKKTIHDVVRVLAENGIMFISDSAGPPSNELVHLRFNSPFAINFYEYFREKFRTFESWEEEVRARIRYKRAPFDPDYPPLEDKTHQITLPFAQTTEVMLHFRNFWDNFQRNLVDIGDGDWKEINESYLVPDFSSTDDRHSMGVNEYTEAVLMEAQKALEDSGYMLTHRASVVSDRPGTTLFLDQHFVLKNPKSLKSSHSLVTKAMRKMDLIFQKVKIVDKNRQFLS